MTQGHDGGHPHARNGDSGQTTSTERRPVGTRGAHTCVVADTVHGTAEHTWDSSIRSRPLGRAMCTRGRIQGINCTRPRKQLRTN